jgi:hypothetical protein
LCPCIHICPSEAGTLSLGKIRKLFVIKVFKKVQNKKKILGLWKTSLHALFWDFSAYLRAAHKRGALDDQFLWHLSVPLYLRAAHKKRGAR